MPKAKDKTLTRGLANANFAGGPCELPQTDPCTLGCPEFELFSIFENM